MELHQIRYFLALARNLNFTRAAEGCGVTQPALTKAVQKLEDEVGGPLLYRERSLTRLTPLGEAMLPYLEQTLVAAEAATAAASSFRHREQQPLRIGLAPAIPAAVLAPVVRELQARFEGLSLEVAAATPDAIAADLLQGDCDAGLVAGAAALPDRLHRWPLYVDSLVVLCAADHPFAGHTEVPLAALVDEGWIARRDDACDLEGLVDDALSAMGARRLVRHRVAGEDLLQHLVAARMGLAVGSARQPLLAGLTSRPLAAPGLIRAVALVAVAGRPYSPPLGAFVNLARARSWADP